MGGHRPKLIAGKHRIWLLPRIMEGNFTLRGLVAELAERGLKVDFRTGRTFVQAEMLSFTKSVVAGERSSRRRPTARTVDKVPKQDRARAAGLRR
jgi:putative transposase